MAKKPAKFAKEKVQDVVGGKKMPWGFEAKKATTSKKAPPKLSKGAQTLANTLMGNNMTMGPMMGGMPGMGGMMAPNPMAPMPPAKAKKKVVKRKTKKK